MSTLADVAREAGVSKAAASYVLGSRTSSARLGADTRQRILDAARQLGYRRNPLAAALSTGRTHNLGVLMHSPATFLTHPNGATAFATLTTAAARRGYRVMLIDGSPEENLDERVVDGLVILGWMEEKWRDRAAALARRLPVVATIEAIPHTVQVRGINDMHDPVRLAMLDQCARYLLDQGHRHMAVVDIYGADNTVTPLSVVRRVAEEQGVAVKLHDFRDRWQVREYPTTAEIAQLDPLPTAVLAFDDDYARTLIAQLARRRLRVPEDVSVFSRHTHRIGHQTPPRLTGMDLHTEQRYEQMMVKFIDMLESNARPKHMDVEMIPAELVVRESCAPPSR